VNRPLWPRHRLLLSNNPCAFPPFYPWGALGTGERNGSFTNSGQELDDSLSATRRVTGTATQHQHIRYQDVPVPNPDEPVGESFQHHFPLFNNRKKKELSATGGITNEARKDEGVAW
jgi:hypothetical protein